MSSSSTMLTTQVFNQSLTRRSRTTRPQLYLIAPYLITTLLIQIPLHLPQVTQVKELPNHPIQLLSQLMMVLRTPVEQTLKPVMILKQMIKLRNQEIVQRHLPMLRIQRSLTIKHLNSLLVAIKVLNQQPRHE